MTTGEKLKKLRNELGLTQNQVIEKLNNSISKNTLVNAENDNCKHKGANDGTLTILAKFYKVNIEYLRDPNCMNKTLETIDMGEYLNLSDESLKKINKVGEYYKKGRNNIFNTFVEDFDVFKFTIMLEELKYLYRIKQIAVDILNFGDKMRELLKKGNDAEIKKKINQYDQMINEYEKITSYGDNLSSYTKFYLDYENIVDFRKLLDEFKEYYNNKKTLIEYEYIFSCLPDVGIDFVADAEREISMQRYNLNRLFESYMDKFGNGMKQYDFQ